MAVEREDLKKGGGPVKPSCLFFPQHSKRPRERWPDARAMCVTQPPLLFRALSLSPFFHYPSLLFLSTHEAKLGRRRNFYFSFSIEIGKGRRSGGSVNSFVPGVNHFFPSLSLSALHSIFFPISVNISKKA